MRLTITTLGDDIYSVEVSSDMELENFKALCTVECGIPTAEMSLIWNGRPLHDDSRTLKDYGILDGEVILAQRIQGAQGQSAAARLQPSGNPLLFGGGFPIDFGSIQIPGSSAQPFRPPAQPVMTETEGFRQLLLNSPNELRMLKERNKPLADALLSGNPEAFVREFSKQREEHSLREAQRVRMINGDPFDPEYQHLIAEEIRLKNVESNMENAMEYAPESFGQVVMLYIDCMVNGHPVKAFVDSGAQMTIMSQSCAERCNIMRLVDSRWAGVAKGVGIQKIIGRVHLCQIQIGNTFLQTSFSILEDQPMDMLLGLDMLKRHQCKIDLQKNELVIGTTGIVTPFLAEGDLPEFARLNSTGEKSDQMEDDRQLAEALAKSVEENGIIGKRQKVSNSPAHATGKSSASATPSAPVALAPIPQASAQASTSPAPAGRNFTEADIRKVMTYGFTRGQAVEELGRKNGNADQAIAALIAKSLPVP